MTDVAAPCSGDLIGAIVPAASSRSHCARVSRSTCFWRRVQIPPGITALAVIPSADQRRVASTANRTFAVFDCA